MREFHNTTQRRENLKENDYALVLTEKITKRDWPIGAINQLLMGRDGLVRSVEVRLPLKAHQVDDDGKHKHSIKSSGEELKISFLFELSKRKQQIKPFLKGKILLTVHYCQ